ncbi:hypothetical protein UT300012_24380 [Paraclostridium bifermentans]
MDKIIKEVFIGFSGLYQEDLSIVGVSANEDKIRECLAQAHYMKVGYPAYYYRKMPLIEVTGFDKDYAEYEGNIFTDKDKDILDEILREYPKSYFSKTEKMCLGSSKSKEVNHKNLVELLKDFARDLTVSKRIDIVQNASLAFCRNFDLPLQFSMYRVCMVIFECFVGLRDLNEENYDEYINSEIVLREPEIYMDSEGDLFKLLILIYSCFDNNEITLGKQRLVEDKELIKASIRDITETYYRDKERGLL